MARKKRIEYIDIAKGIGIILVVAGHLLDKESELCKFIYGFHMPLFFVLSGLLFKENKTFSNFKSIIVQQKKLIIQYCIYSGVFLIFDCIIRVIVLSELEMTQLVWNVYETITLYGINVLWFIPTLCIAKIYAQIVLKKFGMTKGSMISVILYFGVSIVGKYLTMEAASQSIWGLLLYFPICALVRPLGMVCFLLGGYALRIYVQKKRNMSNFSLSKLISISILFFITLFCTQKNTLIDVHFIRFGNALLTLISGVCGSLMIILLSQMLEKTQIVKGILQLYGKNSLLIMAIHQYLFISRGCEFVLKIMGICNIYIDIVLTCIVSISVAELVNCVKRRIQT